MVIRDRLPIVHAGPNVDESIQVDKNIDTTRFPNATLCQELLILYYDLDPVPGLSVSGFISRSLGRIYTQTFPDPNNPGVEFVCLARFRYDFFDARVIYNFCTCRTTQLRGDDCGQFYQTILYGYIDSQGYAIPLVECSEIPLNNLIPYRDTDLAIDCSSC